LLAFSEDHTFSPRSNRPYGALWLQHKLCVHSLLKQTELGNGLQRRDVGVAAGTAIQLRITAALADKLKEASTMFPLLIIAGICIAVIFICPPFRGAFVKFFTFLLDLMCYFILLVMLQILFRYGMHELPAGINRPCGSIIVMFMAWPVILVVCLTIFNRIGNYIYRNVRNFILQDAVPQVVEPASHYMSHILIHSITSSLSHTLSHSLTHTLTHSLSNSVFHFYRCTYCYTYGDYCDMCFYYRDYSWQWRMAWQGNPTLKNPTP